MCSIMNLQGIAEYLHNGCSKYIRLLRLVLVVLDAYVGLRHVRHGPMIAMGACPGSRGAFDSQSSNLEAIFVFVNRSMPLDRCKRGY